MNIPALQSAAKEAAREHERLTRRVESEAGEKGISRLRVMLSQAAVRRIKAENDLNAAQEALAG